MELELEKSLASNISEINRLLLQIPSKHYKVYKIPKRTFGFRTIAQPTKKVKLAQKAVVSVLSKHTEVHHAAKAYVKNRSIVDNAKVHQKSTFLLKMDLENFFNSITPKMLFKALQHQGIEVTDKEKYILEQLLFWNRTRKINGKLVLSVGAPSSPYISNLIMYSFDKRITSICKKMGVAYSRYADDLTFSVNKKCVLIPFIDTVKKSLHKEFGNEILINNSKTVLSSKAHNRHVTGITITNDNKLSLGRDRKRYISSLVHKFKLNKIDHDDIVSLKGLVGLSKNIEPKFFDRLILKYGYQVFSDLNKYGNRGGI
jgi:RNA-directed DNA polymerase